MTKYVRIATRYGPGPHVYEFVNVTDDGEDVIRDTHGDVTVFVASENEWLEARCPRCGAWTKEYLVTDECFSCSG